MVPGTGGSGAWPPPPAKPYLGAGDDLLSGYRLDRFLQVLETEPPPARKRREQQQAIRTEDEAGLLAPTLIWKLGFP